MKKDLWDREEQGTANKGGPFIDNDPRQPRITDISRPLILPPHPDLVEYPRYIRLADGQPKVRVETKDHEVKLRADFAKAQKPAKPMTAAEKKAAEKAAKEAGTVLDDNLQDEENQGD